MVLKTLTCPELLPFPSLSVAPIATVEPSELSETDLPKRSPDASP